MKNSIKTFIYGLTILALVSCAGSKPSSSGTKDTTKDYSNYTNMYDVLASISGLTINRSGRGGNQQSLSGDSGGQYIRNDSGIEISIRGSQSATNTNEPLFVLNGVPLGRGFDNVAGINPVNIKAIKVQRGLASANRWGSEGNSGAILITTKDQN